MAYNLHITRQIEWHIRKPESEISDTDWAKILDEHPELKTVDSIKANGFELFDKGKIAEWTTKTGKKTWFTFYKGNITVTSPNEETIQKMRDVASVLHAKVQGDDGELY